MKTNPDDKVATPRTDAECKGMMVLAENQDFFQHLINHAHQLERELISAKAELEELRRDKERHQLILNYTLMSLRSAMPVLHSKGLISPDFRIIINAIKSEPEALETIRLVLNDAARRENK